MSAMFGTPGSQDSAQGSSGPPVDGKVPSAERSALKGTVLPFTGSSQVTVTLAW
jgi:hypothetical protein